MEHVLYPSAVFAKCGKELPQRPSYGFCRSENAIPEVLSLKGVYNLAVGRFCQTDKLHHRPLVRDTHLLFVKQGPESQYPTR